MPRPGRRYPHRSSSVTSIDQSTDTGFTIQHSHGLLQAMHVILATGGRSVPKSGSDGFGYSLARRLGHSVTTTVPALVPLVLDAGMFHQSLSGLSQEVTLTTAVTGQTVDTRTGSLLWTHFVSDVTAHRRMIENFVHAVGGRGNPACDGREGLRSLALVEAIYVAARVGADAPS